MAIVKNNNAQLTNKVGEMLEKEDFEGVSALIEKSLRENPTAEAYYLRGRLKWKLGHHAEAMSDYSHAVALDPNSPATAALSMAREVMDFYNHDLYNP